MTRNIQGKKVAILTENGFEEVELTSPKRVLEEAGAIVHIVSPQKEKVLAWDHDHWSIDLPVDVHISKAKPEDYDALVLPGGVLNPDKTRINKECVAFVQHFFGTGQASCSDLPWTSVVDRNRNDHGPRNDLLSGHQNRSD